MFRLEGGNISGRSGKLGADPNFTGEDAARFNRRVLDIDAAATAEALCRSIRERVRKELRREGAVIGISGGIDSSVVAALCARALGPERVLGVCMPERESSPRSRHLAAGLAEGLGIAFMVEDITGALEGMGCYRRRDAAMRRVFPDLPPDYKAKITIANNPLEKESLNYFRLTVETPDGKTRSRRTCRSGIPGDRGASNLKQRTRMMALYYHAESLNRAVVGTCNKDEHALGFSSDTATAGRSLSIADLSKCRSSNWRSTSRFRRPSSTACPPRMPQRRGDADRVLLRHGLPHVGPVVVGDGAARAGGGGCRGPGAVARAGRARLPRHRAETAQYGVSEEASAGGPGRPPGGRLGKRT
ncbi:hypothetical protein HS125_08350 [bacterium]|nr:hypothetical protein [bacterium]